MKTMFIELTNSKGIKFIGNVNLLQSVFSKQDGGSIVVGWNNNGGIDVRESFDEICKMLPIKKPKNQ